MEKRLTPQEFADWIGRIYATKEDELDCEQVQSLLPAYVEAGFSQKEMDWLESDIVAHLYQCPDCSETHAGLRFVMRLEAEGDLAFEPATAGAETSLRQPTG